MNAKRATHSDSTVRLIFSVLHRVLEQAVEWELMARKPAAKVERPRAGEPHDSFLSAAEAGQLLATARGTRLYALVAVALAIGLRRGEALALRWSAVDLDSGSVTVRRTSSRVCNGLIVTTPRGHLQVIAEILGHSDIRVTSAVYAHVGARLQRDAAERMASALDW